MPTNDPNIKKLYDETAIVITKLYYEKKITEPEMLFLLNLLDFIWLDNKKDDLLIIIRKWLDIHNDSELDEIIKETLLTLDFSSEESINKMANMIRELLLAKNE